MSPSSPIFPTIAARPSDQAVIQATLDSLRECLGMEVGYLSEFVQDRAVFRVVSAPGLEAMISPSQSMDLREVYCKHILDGGLPNLMTDTQDHAIAVELPITQMIPIGSHLSVPVQRPDGTVFGMFCFLSRQPRRDLGPEALEMVWSGSASVAQRLATLDSDAA